MLNRVMTVQALEWPRVHMSVVDGLEVWPLNVCCLPVPSKPVLAQSWMQLVHLMKDGCWSTHLRAGGVDTTQSMLAALAT